MVALQSHCTPLYQGLGDPAQLCESMCLVSWNKFLSTVSVLQSFLVAVNVHPSKVVIIVPFHSSFRGQKSSLYAEVVGSTFLQSCKLID